MSLVSRQFRQRCRVAVASQHIGVYRNYYQEIVRDKYDVATGRWVAEDPEEAAMRIVMADPPDPRFDDFANFLKPTYMRQHLKSLRLYEEHKKTVQDLLTSIYYTNDYRKKLAKAKDSRKRQY